MSAEDETGEALRLLLDPFVRKVTSQRRDKRETIMHLAMRLDPSFKPTASTLKARERQAGKRLIEIYAERDAAMTSPSSDEEAITAASWLEGGK